MIVLGISGFEGTPSHDAAAALVRDGKVVVAAEEERFSRRKHAPGVSPLRATQFCLKEAGLTLDEVDAVATGWNIENRLLSTSPAGERNEWARRTFPQDLFPTTRIPEVYYIKHHLSHLTGAFYMSGFEDAACICVDGQGESESITLAVALRGRIEIIRSYPPLFSLGALYESAAVYAGLGWNVPGKLMGLAPYGSACHDIPLAYDPNSGEFSTNLPGVSPDTTDFSTACSVYRQYFQKHIYPFKEGGVDEVMSYIHFAASVQRALERLILGMAQFLKKHTASTNLVICGGVALNCTGNGVVERSGLYKRLYVPPGANDASCAMGSALEVVRHRGGFDRAVPAACLDARLGPRFSDEEIRCAFDRAGLKPNYLPDEVLCRRVAAALHTGAVVIWFEGRAEFGPRALGARSILANPCDRGNHSRVNRIKSRELWRPLSPCILAERYQEFFQGEPTAPAAFMLKADLLLPHVALRVPAIAHIDGSARPHAVRPELQPRFHRMISCFDEVGGVPIVMNTSLNRRGEPIANTPDDALAIFHACPDIDVIAVEGFVYIRPSFVEKIGLTDESDAPGGVPVSSRSRLDHAATACMPGGSVSG